MLRRSRVGGTLGWPLSDTTSPPYITAALAPFEPVQVSNTEMIVVCCTGLSEESKGEREGVGLE